MSPLCHFVLKFRSPLSQQDCSVSLLLRMSVSVAFGVLCRINRRRRRINDHYTRWSKGQNREGRFRCLTCSTPTVGLRDGDGGQIETKESQDRQQEEEEKGEEEKRGSYDLFS